jgi:large subunit ribosomal protein L13
MKSYMARNDDFEKKWYLIDARGKPVGRLASSVVSILRGKGKPQFAPHSDIGDFVVVVNADKATFSGRKWEQKTYYRHSHYPGGLKSMTAEELAEKEPGEIIRKAVWGMLPKNRWQKKLIQRVKIYVGDKHPHTAQNPEVLEV